MRFWISLTIALALGTVCIVPALLPHLYGWRRMGDHVKKGLARPHSRTQRLLFHITMGLTWCFLFSVFYLVVKSFGPEALRGAYLGVATAAVLQVAYLFLTRSGRDLAEDYFQQSFASFIWQSDLRRTSLRLREHLFDCGGLDSAERDASLARVGIHEGQKGRLGVARALFVRIGAPAEQMKVLTWLVAMEARGHLSWEQGFVQTIGVAREIGLQHERETLLQPLVEFAREAGRVDLMQAALGAVGVPSDD